MKKIIKLLSLALICSALIITCVACKKEPEIEDTLTQEGTETETFKSKEEVQSSLTNYSLKYEYSYTGGETTNTIQYLDKRAENVWMYSIDNSIYISDMNDNSLYLLNPDKSGTITKLGDNQTFSTFDLYNWYQNVDSFNKIRTATVAGRNCNVYTYTVGTYLSYEYYIDTEYDICLKYVGRTSENTVSFTFIEFSIGNTTSEEILGIISEYTLDDYRYLF